jgi:hypothetical protein
MTENVPPTAASSLPLTRAQKTVQVLSALGLFAVFGADFVDAVRFGSAELAAFTYPPSLLLNGVAVLLTLGACAAAINGHLKKLGNEYRGHRLLAITAVVLFFMNFFVLSSARSPVSAADQAHLAIFELARRIESVAQVGAVPSKQADIDALLRDMLVPPYWAKGERLKEYRLEVRQGCKGPATEVNGAPPATLIYCVSEGAKEGWVTLVGLPMGTRFGQPTIVSRGGLPVAAEVHAGVPEEPEPPPPPQDQTLPGSRWEDIETPVEPPEPLLVPGQPQPESRDAQ